MPVAHSSGKRGPLWQCTKGTIRAALMARARERIACGLPAVMAPITLSPLAIVEEAERTGADLDELARRARIERGGL